MVPDPPTDEIRFVDLCAGLGGFHHALSVAAEVLRTLYRKEIRFQCVAASEIQADLRECYVRNFSDVQASYLGAHTPADCAALRGTLSAASPLAKAIPAYGPEGQLISVHGDMACFLTDDLKELRRYPSGADVLPSHDLLCAGFPCQPFSKSGAQRGFDDTRGTVFHMIATMLRHRRPAFVLLENVGNFEKHDGGNTWRRVHEILTEELGYDVIASEHISRGRHAEGLLSPHHLGFPHHRERFFIVAQRRVALKSDRELIKGILESSLTSRVLPSRTATKHWLVSPNDRAKTTLKKIISSGKEFAELADLQQAQVSPERVACISHWQKLLTKLASVDETLKSSYWRDSMPSFPIWGYELDPWHWYTCDENPSTFRVSDSERRSDRKSNLAHAREEVLSLSARECDIFNYPPSGERAWLRGLDGASALKKWIESWPAYARKRDEWPDWKRKFISQNRAWAMKVWAAVGGQWMREWLDDLYLQIPVPSYQKLEWNCKGEALDLWSQILQFRPSGLRVKRLAHVPALVAMTTTQVPIVPSLNTEESTAGRVEGARGRHLIRSEALQLQGFPADWVIPSSRERAFACFGNAVHAGLVAGILVNWFRVVERSGEATLQDEFRADTTYRKVHRFEEAANCSP
ncbi:DNA (cytosine-5-)-methyltransferase [Luteibacter aegosomatis]|uniref:DNA (cytosine-5-)-methyltransferase n=1 Tax=Luteibacter aegosomatis TaxID=2911537 RepID=UPI001FF8EA87|nr:DNA (cytosine-5-)-methyltransferase [Luteibacter aegosomatis]UPG87809.1 DNA (cytosine-5-)-methyltransferase [Luteibacter aegosomatis]